MLIDLIGLEMYPITTRKTNEQLLNVCALDLLTTISTILQYVIQSEAITIAQELKFKFNYFILFISFKRTISMCR